MSWSFPLIPSATSVNFWVHVTIRLMASVKAVELPLLMPFVATSAMRTSRPSVARSYLIIFDLLLPLLSGVFLLFLQVHRTSCDVDCGSCPEICRGEVAFVAAMQKNSALYKDAVERAYFEQRSRDVPFSPYPASLLLVFLPDKIFSDGFLPLSSQVMIFFAHLP